MLNVICKIKSVDDENKYLLVHSHKENNSMVRLQFGDGSKLVGAYSWDILNAIENAMSTGNPKRGYEGVPVEVDCEIMDPDNEENLALTIRSDDAEWRNVRVAFPKGGGITVRGEDLTIAVENCRNVGLRRVGKRYPIYPRRSRFERDFDDEE